MQQAAEVESIVKWEDQPEAWLGRMVSVLTPGVVELKPLAGATRSPSFVTMFAMEVLALEVMRIFFRAAAVAAVVTTEAAGVGSAHPKPMLLAPKPAVGEAAPRT
jgi:hypothetical protein